MNANSDLLIGIFGNPGKHNVITSICPVLDYLNEKKVNFIVEKDVSSLLIARSCTPSFPINVGSRKEIATNASMIMTFGGDGTILAAAKATLPYDAPILGVNLGKLGFLADINSNEILAAIDMILAGKYFIEERMTLHGAFDEQRDDLHALNDIVISKSGVARVINIEAYVNEDFLGSFLADGIIISTPTGSTAYSLATGGPIVIPSTNVIIISLISAHTLTARPIIVPGGSIISLRTSVEDGAIMVMADGKVAVRSIKSIALKVQRGARNVKLLKLIGTGYFDMLRRKLSWGQDTRFMIESE